MFSDTEIDVMKKKKINVSASRKVDNKEIKKHLQSAKKDFIPVKEKFGLQNTEVFLVEEKPIKDIYNIGSEYNHEIDGLSIKSVINLKYFRGIRVTALSIKSLMNALKMIENNPEEYYPKPLENVIKSTSIMEDEFALINTKVGAGKIESLIINDNPTQNLYKFEEEYREYTNGFTIHSVINLKYY